ncbi:MAG: monofunctional biosynthetic peptidoglycan transglycosylase [Alloprevotella sp.]|nr:monofunctional biosynthetic peptidoglycan transglycosylase [Alloprevotella sp.]
MRYVVRFLKWAVILFFSSSILGVLYYKWMPVEYTPLMLIRYAQQSGADGHASIKHRWVPLDSIPAHMQLAVIASEDQNFRKHYGFDVGAIEQAIEERERTGRRRGASTISQQTAKNVFLWPNSDWVRKGFEAYFTVLIEIFWSKDRILEVYLNSIEMGRGIYGVQAAAEEHFGTSAYKLKRGESALLAACLPNPLKYNAGVPSSYVRSRQRWILRQMKNLE